MIAIYVSRLYHKQLARRLPKSGKRAHRLLQNCSEFSNYYTDTQETHQKEGKRDKNSHRDRLGQGLGMGILVMETCTGGRMGVVTHVTEALS